MDLRVAKNLVNEQLVKFELDKQGWTFKFDRAKNRSGLCSFTKKTIQLSKPITKLNEEHKIKNTIMHEIAHALVGPHHGHDHVWRNKAIELGCNGHTCSDNITAKPKYVGLCPVCGSVHFKNRLKLIPTGACSSYCRKYNGGQWSDKYIIIWRENN